MQRVWFITGASSGFGRALAEAVLTRGDSAVVSARRKDALDRLAIAHAQSALAIGLDVTDAAARLKAVEAALARFGRIDVLANIAGRGSLGAAEEFEPEQLRDQMEVNFFAAAEMTRAVLPAMRAQRSGHILKLTSIGGLVSIGGFGPYCASKFALEGWSEALRDEVKPHGVRVTTVEPGAFRTEFAGAVNMRPARRLGAYRPVIDPIEAYLYGGDGKQPGDPAKAAQAMIAVVESDDPPPRLLLGADAIGVLEQKRADFSAELVRWRAIGEATAFDDADRRLRRHMRPSPIALVTGANRGIGREVCRQLAENRMRVLIGARDPAKGEAAALQMARGGFDVEAVALDVTDAASIQALGDKLGAADVLINNAGVDYDTDQTPISADLARVRKTRQQRLPGLAIDRYGRPGRHVQDGAASVVWAAMLPDDGPTGGFFRNGRPVAW